MELVRRRLLVLLVGILTLAGVHPSPVGADGDQTTVGSGAVRVVVHHEPFRIAVLNGDRILLESAAPEGVSAPGALSFALGVRAGAQTPLAAYGVFAEAGAWFHSTRAEHLGGGQFQVYTSHPGRSFRVSVEIGDMGRVQLRAVLNDDSNVVATGAAFVNDRAQRFLGFGERSEGPNQDGQVVEQWNAEGPFSAGALRPAVEPVLGATWQGPPPIHRASNYTMPWFLSNRGYGFLLQSTWLNRFDLRRDETWSVATAEPAIRWSVFPGVPSVALAAATAEPDFGRQPDPAPWFFGPWVQMTGSAQLREDLLRGWRASLSDGGLDVPVTVSQTYTHYLPCGDHLRGSGRAGQRALVERHHAWGYRITTYVNSFVCRTHAGDAYSEGDRANHFVQRPGGGTYPILNAAIPDAPTLGLVDFTSPAAAAYWRELVRPALEDGYDGWMEDFGEYVPPSARLSDGRRGLAAHNDYCTAYHRASQQLTVPARGVDFAQFVRCGYTGTAPHARIVWGGDPSEDDSQSDGLAAALSQGLTMGLSGVSYWGSDIGGFHGLFTSGRTSPELLIRWLELGAFSGIMRTQAEGYGRPVDPSSRAQVWDPEVLPHWRAMARLRTQLFPYVWDAAVEYQRSGLPIMRHLALTYPDEDVAWGIGDDSATTAAASEYMFGPDLLVAPVLTDGQRSRDVWLPPGKWIDLWDVLAYEESSGEYRNRMEQPRALNGGTTRSVAAPLGRPLVYARLGTCLSLLPADVDTLSSGRGFLHDDDVVGLDEVTRLREVAIPQGACPGGRSPVPVPQDRSVDLHHDSLVVRMADTRRRLVAAARLWASAWLRDARSQTVAAG